MTTGEGHTHRAAEQCANTRPPRSRPSCSLGSVDVRKHHYLDILPDHRLMRSSLFSVDQSSPSIWGFRVNGR